jgi:SWI/SNF-related matrix-associated actin-dependent regulator of chromatin subfamily A-like protein 1
LNQLTIEKNDLMSALPFAVPHIDAIGSLPKGLLYPHQADGVIFLISKGRAILADDMGLGKTRQAIVGMQVAAPEGAILVVCPASLKLNWRREIRLVDSDASIAVIGGRPDRPEDGHPPRWVIVNYDLLKAHAARLHDISWAGVILDEAHFIKNNSQRTSHVLSCLAYPTMRVRRLSARRRSTCSQARR